MTPRTGGQWEKFPAAKIDGDERYGVQSRDGLLVCDCGVASNPYSEGNARLIAAAPELLATLNALVSELPNYMAKSKAVIDAKFAIAKAEGL